MPKPRSLLLGCLFLCNLVLQGFDGLVTYHAVSMGVPEANPLVQAAIARWGVDMGLLFWKGVACGCLGVLFALRKKRPILVAQGLTVTGALYLCGMVAPALAVLW
jgi:hypothetical protein